MYILLLSEQHDYVHKKYPSKAKLLQREFHKFAFLDSMDIEHLSPYMAQNETGTDCIVLTERKDIIFRRYAWYRCNLHNIANMYCAVCTPIARLQDNDYKIVKLYIKRMIN